MYPDYAEIDGKEYKIDTDFKTALKCFEVIEDKEITDFERANAVVYLLFDFIPSDKELLEKLLEKAKIYLQCGKSDEEQSSNKKDMDFNEDRGRINASFMSDYHLDLSKTDLHFWQFIEDLEGLTENCILTRVRNLRNIDLKEIKDLKEREKIQKAQKQVELKNQETKVFTEQQKKNIQRFLEQTKEA